MIQGTEEWFAARLGKVTASRVVDILPGKKGNYLASREKYRNEILVERLTGEGQETFQSAPMRRGLELEASARGQYEGQTERRVRETGVVDHPRIPNFAASPDGLMDGRGLEIKIPNDGTHFALLLGGEIDFAYIVQMHVGMMCAEMDLWDYFNFDPRFSPGLDVFLKTIERDQELVKRIELEVVLFLAEVDAMETALRERIIR